MLEIIVGTVTRDDGGSVTILASRESQIKTFLANFTFAVSPDESVVDMNRVSHKSTKFLSCPYDRSFVDQR